MTSEAFLSSPSLPSLASLGAVCALLVAGVGLALRSAYRRSSSDGADTAARATDPRRHQRTAGYWLCGLALVVALWAGVDGLVSPSVPVVVAGFVVAVGLAHRVAPAHTSETLAYGGAVAVAAVLVAAVATPLSGLSLPDVGVLGPYTYLATEVVFGAVALGLLVRAGRDALRSAARTVAVVYPVAYVWDWYTLTVGVFAIPLRTGVELAGIPVEEHLFMLVVPGFVLGVHETLREPDQSR